MVLTTYTNLLTRLAHRVLLLIFQISKTFFTNYDQTFYHRLANELCSFVTKYNSTFQSMYWLSMVFEIIHRMYTHNKSIQFLMIALMTSNLNSSLHYSFTQRVLDYCKWYDLEKFLWDHFDIDSLNTKLTYVITSFSRSIKCKEPKSRTLCTCEMCMMNRN